MLIISVEGNPDSISKIKNWHPAYLCGCFDDLESPEGQLQYELIFRALEQGKVCYPAIKQLSLAEWESLHFTKTSIEDEFEDISVEIEFLGIIQE